MVALIDLASPDLDAVRAAIEETGIVQVVNHGVPLGFDERAARLLAVPRAEKAALASPTGHPYRGWRQWPDDFGRLELERFNVGQFDNVSAARAAGLAPEYLGLYSHENVWPDPAFRAAAQAYAKAARGLAERMLALYATALDLPADTFPVSPLPHLSLTVNNYPTWTYAAEAADEDKLLLLEHADGSAVTILSQAGDYEGLQIQQPSGDWEPVPIVPGALQVFSGTLLTRWTNGLLRPARHRVVAGGIVTRRSVALFYYPGLDLLLEPLPPFASPESDYEPVTTWDLVKDNVENYLKVFGRPEQVSAWREGKPYVAELAENSAGQ